MGFTGVVSPAIQLLGLTVCLSLSCLGEGEERMDKRVQEGEEVCVSIRTENFCKNFCLPLCCTPVPLMHRLYTRCSVQKEKSVFLW